MEAEVISILSKHSEPGFIKFHEAYVRPSVGGYFCTYFQSRSFLTAFLFLLKGNPIFPRNMLK